MNKINRAGRIAAGAIGFLIASTAVAERVPVGPEGDADGVNHYILECHGQCSKSASTTAIDPAFTGAWFDPTQSGHGLFIEVLPGNRIQAAWFAFNPSGTEQAWFVGEGTYLGNTATLTAVKQPAGGRWIPNFDPARIVANSWGTLTLTFTSCDQGSVAFTSTQGYGTGSMNLTRLTQPAGLACPSPASMNSSSTSTSQAGWVATGSMNIARVGDTATLLADGKVLVVGGFVRCTLDGESSTEVFDPATGTWTLTGSTNFGRRGHTATLLSNGMVLVTGGLERSVELYDPVAGTWTPTGSMSVSRLGHTATRMSDGKVLVVGGETYQDESAISSCEVYDPATGLWTLTGALKTARENHSATILPDGKVLVLGGCAWYFDEPVTFSSAELYDPIWGTWASAGSLTVPRVLHGAVLLLSGKVLVMGGLQEDCPACVHHEQSLQTSELFDPITGTSTAAGDLNVGRFSAAATLLATGDVLLVGGVLLPPFSDVPSAETYDSKNAQWQSVGEVITPRHDHTATLLLDGRVLIAGGRTEPNGTRLASAEIYGNVPAGTIGPGYTGSWFDPAQSGHGLFVEVLPDNRFLAGWFTFSPAGTEQSWFIGVGTYRDNTATIANVIQPSGGRWIPKFDPTRIANNPWAR